MTKYAMVFCATVSCYRKILEMSFSSAVRLKLSHFLQIIFASHRCILGKNVAYVLDVIFEVRLLLLFGQVFSSKLKLKR